MSFCFGVIGKTPGLISHNNFVKKNFFVCIGYRNNALASCDSIFHLLRCQGVWNDTCTQLLFSKILFQNPKNYSLWGCLKILLSFLLRFDGYFYQTSSKSNVYLSSGRFWTTTSLAIFYELPYVSKSKIPPKNV